MQFYPLNIRTAYSFLESSLRLSDLQRALQQFQYPGMGICDRHVMYGICPFTQVMSASKTPHALGVSLMIDQFELSIYIKNNQGYLNLVHLVNTSDQEPLTFEALSQHKDGLIVVFPVLQTNLNPFEEDVIHELKKILLPYHIFHQDFYLGLDMNDAKYHPYNQQVRGFADHYNYQLIAFPRIEYYAPSEALNLRILQAIKYNAQLDIRELEGPNHFRTMEEYATIYQNNEIANQEKLIQSIEFQLFEKRGQILDYGALSGQDSKILIEELAMAGLARLYKEQDTMYLERLQYELKIIDTMGFNDYFLIVQDAVNWAKTHAIPIGPGRGSAPSSLVSYCLNITEVDPVKFGLLFERFLNPERQSMPDIDIDIDDTKRDLLIRYLYQRFGPKKVSYVVTFQTIGAKQAIRDIGRVYDYPSRTIDRLAKALRNPFFGLRESYRKLAEFRDLVDSDPINLEIVTYASKIEGLIRQHGLHAAGIIMNDADLETIMPIVHEQEYLVSQYEKDYLEPMNFLKIDFLGLRNMHTIDYALSLIGDPQLKLDTIPYDDPKIFQLLNDDLVMGIFQLESPGMRRAIQSVGPDSFEDIVATIALFRPGPMANIPTFSRRKRGLEEIPALIKPLDSILGVTYGIIVYQEQIMEIVTKMGGFSYAKADIFRKAISSKDRQIMQKLQDDFIDSAIKNGYDKADATSVFMTIAKFASYGFNRSHSVSYAMIAARMAYLKAYYPQEFFIALLETVTAISAYKIEDYLKEMRKFNIRICLPDIRYATFSFTKYQQDIMIPFYSIKGMREDTIKKIVAIREQYGGFQTLYDTFVKLSLINLDRHTYLDLIDVGAFDQVFASRETLRLNLSKLLDFALMFQNQFLHGEDPNASSLKPLLETASDDAVINHEKEKALLGVAISHDLLELNREILANPRYAKVDEVIKGRYPGEVEIAGKISASRMSKTKAGALMAFVELATLHGEISLVFFPQTFEKYQTLLRYNSLIAVRGRLETNQDRTSFIVTTAQLLAPKE